jgi:phospholipase C
MTSRFGSLRVFSLGIALAVAGCGSAVSTGLPTQTGAVPTSSEVAIPPSVPPVGGDIHAIKHVIVIMQENRSFDTYFGTYPGADGIPMSGGAASVCVPDPARGGCDARST